MTTSRLYHSDSYATSFDAQVLAVRDGGKTVVLDQTLFYPSSGGQPHDLGTLGGIPVVEVVDGEAEIVHRLADAVAGEVATLHGRVDWGRRFDHMQQHTGQHLLSAVAAELFGYGTLSFHMGEEVSTIELDAAELSDAEMDEVERRTMELIGEVRPVQISWEDASAAANLRKASQRTGRLRIVEIAGVDRSACGGTHLRSTAELGFVQIRGRERVRGHARIEFVCGLRALRQAKADYRLLSQLGKECGVPAIQLPGWLAKQRAHWESVEKERMRLTAALGERDGRDAYTAAERDASGVRKLHRRLEQLDEYARAFATAFIGYPAAVLLLIASNGGSVMLAASPDSGWHAGKRLQQALQAVSGRGGGSAVMAQGSVPPGREEELLEALGFGATEPSATH